MHQSFHTSTNAPTHNHIIHTHSNILVNTQTYSHIHNKNSQTHKHYHFNQLTVKIWQVLRLQVDGPSKKAQVVFVIYFAPSTHCKYDFIPFTQLQWASTWKLRICHITLSAVPSKTEHRILYDRHWWLENCRKRRNDWQCPGLSLWGKWEWSGQMTCLQLEQCCSR